MSSPRSGWSLVPAVFGLALGQQALYFLITSGLAVTTSDAPRNWGVTAIFVLGSALLNTAFYSAAWLGFLDAARIAARVRRIYIVGLLAAVFFFTLASALSAQIDPKGPFGSYAQMAVLAVTIASAFKLNDARAAVLGSEEK